jgi:hypothetical protein
LLRHTGLMTPDMVAEAVAMAVTLPTSHQYDILSMSPAAPVENLPGTYDQFIDGMIRRHMPAS